MSASCGTNGTTPSRQNRSARGFPPAFSSLSATPTVAFFIAQNLPAGKKKTATGSPAAVFASLSIAAKNLTSLRR